MIGIKMLTTSLRTSCIKNVCLNVNQSTSLRLITGTSLRSYRSAPKSFTRNIRPNEAIQGLKKKVGPMEVGQIAAAGGAALGLGALCFYGMGLSNEPGAVERMLIWPEHIKARVRDTYLYFGASVGAVAASAITVFRTPAGQRFITLCASRPILSTVGILVGLIATGQAMMSVPYAPGIGTKQMLWLLNCGVLGLAIAPVGIFGGAIAIRAAWYTAGIVGGLSLVAVTAPSEKFLNWGGPLGIGLGGILIASLGSAFLPPTSALGLTLYSVSLYGGLLLFSGFLLYDTQKVVKKAETHPTYYAPPYDPINASHHIVMDTVNIFVRLVQIFAMGGGRRK